MGACDTGFFTTGFLATFIAAGAVALLFVVFVLTHVVLCCQRVCARRRPRLSDAEIRTRRQTQDDIRIKLGKKTDHEIQLSVITVLSGLSGMISTQVLTDLLTRVSREQLSSTSNSTNTSDGSTPLGDLGFAASALVGGVVLTEYIVLALNSLKMAVWAMPLSAVKLALTVGMLWIMRPCNGFSQTNIVQGWVILALSVAIMVYSYVLWVQFQRHEMHQERMRYQVHLEAALVSASIIGVFAGNFFANFLTTALDTPGSVLDPKAIIATGIASLLAFAGSGLLRVQSYGASLCVAVMLVLETLAAMIWVETHKNSDTYNLGVETETLGWGLCGLSAIWCVQVAMLRHKTLLGEGKGTARDLSTHDWREWHAEILSVFTSAAQIFSVFLFSNALELLVSPKTYSDSPTQLTRNERIGFVTMTAAIIVLQFVSDLLDSIPRYFWAVVFTVLDVMLLVASLIYTHRQFSHWPTSTKVYNYIVLVLAMIALLYLLALKFWRSLRKKQARWRKARADAAAARSMRVQAIKQQQQQHAAEQQQQQMQQQQMQPSRFQQQQPPGANMAAVAVTAAGPALNPGYRHASDGNVSPLPHPPQQQFYQQPQQPYLPAAMMPHGHMGVASGLTLSGLLQPAPPMPAPQLMQPPPFPPSYATATGAPPASQLMPGPAYGAFVDGSARQAQYSPNPAALAPAAVAVAAAAAGAGQELYPLAQPPPSSSSSSSSGVVPVLTMTRPSRLSEAYLDDDTAESGVHARPSVTAFLAAGDGGGPPLDVRTSRSNEPPPELAETLERRLNAARGAPPSYQHAPGYDDQ